MGYSSTERQADMQTDLGAIAREPFPKEKGYERCNALIVSAILAGDTQSLLIAERELCSVINKRWPTGPGEDALEFGYVKTLQDTVGQSLPKLDLRLDGQEAEELQGAVLEALYGGALQCEELAHRLRVPRPQASEQLVALAEQGLVDCSAGIWSLSRTGTRRLYKLAGKTHSEYPE
jgi:DNA-binding transcriptional ArsR family regulator